VRVCEQAGDVIERAALSRFRGVADQEHELVGMVLGSFDLEERLVAGHRATRDEQLGEDRDRVSLGVRRELSDDRAWQPVVGGLVWRRRPPVRDREFDHRPGRRRGHSESSASAARAAFSSQIVLLVT
jgi:hypothetical protein